MMGTGIYSNVDGRSNRESHLLRTCWLAAVVVFGAEQALHATPPADPICGSPNGEVLMRAIRAQREAALTRRATQRLQGPEPLPKLWIERVPSVGLPRLVLQGSAGRTYHLETKSELALPDWRPWLSVRAGNEPTSWREDPAANGGGVRFFRLRQGEPDVTDEWASNFRLLDAQGIAHDLYYHTHLAGIAVLAAGTNLTEIGPLVPLLAELGRVYSNKVQTWILLSDPAPVRSNVLAQAKSLGLGFPVLLDSDGLAASSVGLAHVGEVALVRSPDFTVSYRGDPVGPDGVNPGSSLLGQALASLVDRAPSRFLRTPVQRASLAHSGQARPDYARDIAPILHEYCAKCHRQDGVAPFALTNHSVVAEWAPTIKHALLSGQMPPWHADPEYGRFSNDLSLPGHLKSALIRWIDAGAPRGPGGDPLAELLPPPAFDRRPEELGEPDAVVTIPEQSVKARGFEAYRYIFTHTPNTSNVRLKAAIIRHPNVRSVHHSLVWKGHIGNQGTMDSSSYEAHLAEYVPGFKPFQLPSDAGILLTASNEITFNLHYTPYGVETNDRPVLELWYHRTKPSRAWVSLASPGNGTFSIPPMARDHPVSASWLASTEVTLHRVNPHMHLRGKRARFEAVYPNGRREVLLSVPDYDFNWQIGYTFAEPKVLPAGTRLLFSGAFDNSPQNLANPDPTARVTWGDQSWMEMFAGFIDFTQ